MNDLLLVVFCFLVLPIAPQAGAAQAAPARPESLSPESLSPESLSRGYEDEAAVVERDDVVYRYSVDGNGLKTETTVIRVQSGAALQTFAVLGFPYASGTQGLEISYARVRKPDGSVVETPASDAQDQPAQVTQVAPMYSDLHLKQLPVRSLAVGDKLEFATKVTFKTAEVPGEFWNVESFGVGLVYLDRRIELRVPKAKALTVYSPKFPAETSNDGEEKVYRWKGAQLRSSTAKEDEDPQPDKLPPIAWTTFPSWEAVGTWYQGLIAGRDAVTPALQAKADELTLGAKTDEDKVRRLYEYVALHNHYIGVDFGLGRYQPHTAMEVFTDQYGDCKDKHTLLAALLRAKGFRPSAVLIGVGIEMNEKVPMPGAFNHVITEVEVNGAPVWLDATTEVAPYRVLVAMIRDREGLVVPAKDGPGAPRLAKTPAELPFPAVDHYEGAFELAKDGTTKGNVSVSMRGDDEVVMRYATRQVPRAQWDQLGQSYVDNSGFNGKANTVKLDAGEDLSKPWEMRYGYTQDAWSNWSSYQIGSLLPNVNLPSIDEKKLPKKEIELGGRHTQMAKSTVKLPAGYAVEVPNAIHLRTAFAKFDETYRVVDGSLVSEFTYEVTKPKVEAADWKSVKKFVDDIGVQPWVQVTSSTVAAGEKGPPGPGENVPAAAALVKQVYEAIQAKNYEEAQKKSDQAIAINDKQAYAWSQRGALAWQRKNFTEAATDYERELKQHPEEVDQYPDLIRLLRFLGRTEAERKCLLAYAKAAPNNQQALLYVGSSLMGMNHAEDAVDVYRAGAKALPDDKMIQVELGSALLRVGKKDEAVAIERSALSESADANVLNDGAYVLVSAGSGTELPLAETAAKKAVDVLEGELAGTAIESVNAETFRQANLLLATWDTLGWVYFAEGKDKLAEEYVRGSWQSAMHGEEGLHLGEILEKKGDAAGALKAYELALSAAGKSTAPWVPELHTRADSLKKKGVADRDLEPSRVLLEQRTYHVARTPEAKGSGVFAMRVSAEKTEQVAMESGDESLRSMVGAIGKLELGLAVPKESRAPLLRSGVLVCAGEPTCELVLIPPESANVK